MSDLHDRKGRAPDQLGDVLTCPYCYSENEDSECPSNADHFIYKCEDCGKEFDVTSFQVVNYWCWKKQERNYEK